MPHKYQVTEQSLAQGLNVEVNEIRGIVYYVLNLLAAWWKCSHIKVIGEHKNYRLNQFSRDEQSNITLSVTSSFTPCAFTIANDLVRYSRSLWGCKCQKLSSKYSVWVFNDFSYPLYMDPPLSKAQEAVDSDSLCCHQLSLFLVKSTSYS